MQMTRPSWWSVSAHREQWAESLLDRLTPAMSVLGIIFVLVVVAQQMTLEGSALGAVLSVLGWLLWAVFVVEFLARVVVAPDTGRFWRRNWWQVIFLVLPFLRVLRLARTLRLMRSGRVFSSAVRGSRSARAVLGGRLGWLVSAVTVAVLLSSQLLYEFAGYATYALALHDASLGAMTGEPLTVDGAVARVAEVLLAAFSVVVFGTLAAALGAFLIERRSDERSDASR